MRNRVSEVQNKRTAVGKSASTGAQLKCPYINAQSMGKNQEELQMCQCLPGYGDMVGWLSLLKLENRGSQLFRNNRQSRRGRGDAVYIKDQLEFMDPHLG